MKHARFLRSAAAAVALAAAAALPAGAETIKFAHWVPPAHTLTKSTIEPLQAAVEGSGLEIEVYPGGELGAGPLEQYVRVVQGVADIVWGLQGYTSSQFPKTMVSELPGALPEGMTGYDLIWNAYDAGLLAEEFPGTVPLALWLSEPNVFIMKDIDVRTPDDLQGLKIRVSGSAAAATVEALGATPVQMPAGEIYNSLQTGLIDGVITGASAIGDFKLDEVANSYTLNAPLGHISFYVVMNQAKYDSLPEAERAAIDSIAGRALSQSAEDGWNARAQQVIDEISATGDNTVYSLSADERAAFEAITHPVTDEIVSGGGYEDVLKTMQGM
ncbi:TRAP transporter substrate-binding protein [Sinisalibacter aestuarii]|uniref:C4-dicarboxylate ABC transporter substrate-binding protein n=1 Tax=Sinisalibacter aestuarii TaxID=2949426 RepID=A0ABQ5LNQ5_9RHOB|nr:TRAP transporter substrate-binding protein [Sinisalibacter aestuarii]GKY86642.1 C4-dicarboxylate ABC transporter substrate-binding protein [Sinisalibacter aestuarii]